MKIQRIVAAAALAVCFLFTNQARSEALDNWHWRNPLPDGNPYRAMNGIVFANGKFVAVGDAATVAVSTDATNWLEIATGGTDNLNAIVYANGRYVAVGNNGRVQYSTDATNWTVAASSTTNSLRAIAYGGGNYVAVGEGGTIISSGNANIWLVRASTTGEGFTSVAYGSSGFIAVGPLNYLFLSADGISWSNQLRLWSPMPSKLVVHQSVAFIAGVYLVGSKVYSSGAGHTPVIFRSTSNTNWFEIPFGTVSAQAPYTTAFFLAGNGVLLAKTGQTYDIHSSTDGTNWTGVVTPGLNTDSADAGVFANGLYVIANGSQILVSTDYTNWLDPRAQPVGATSSLNGIAFGNGRYVAAADLAPTAVSSNGSPYLTVSNSPAFRHLIYTTNGFIGVRAIRNDINLYQSSDGLVWTPRNSATSERLIHIADNGSLKVAVGQVGTIQTSPSGALWTSRNSGTSQALSGVTYGRGLFVVVGVLGTVLTSPDGITWTGQDSGQLQHLNAVTYGTSGFVAVGVGGTILTSPDGTNWTARTSGTTSDLSSVSFGNGYYLVGPVIMTSPDGIGWTPRDIGLTGYQAILESAFIDGKFIVVGTEGTVLESDPIVPPFNLTLQQTGGSAVVTVIAPVGSNFRIQAAPSIGGTWTNVASFTNVPAVTQWADPASNVGQRIYRAVTP